MTDATPVPECEKCGQEINGQWHSYGADYYHPDCDPNPERRAEDCPDLLKQP
ncbi:hypothetical protein [Haloarcula vallismortis]|uniref:hypothetical protein n=1 Tax=Haloarcula vallismortis TaxID=28442 RepID=UPI00135F1270|nr:hypothetical protein [Haloarcula vallismortis]